MKKTLITSALLLALGAAAPAYACLEICTADSATWAVADAKAEQEQEQEQSSLTKISVKAGSLDGNAALAVSAGKMFSGVVPLSLSVEGWHAAGGHNALAAMATGSFMIANKTALKAGGGAARLNVGNGWETAPMARLGISRLEQNVSFDLEASRFFADDSGNFDAITAGLTVYF